MAGNTGPNRGRGRAPGRPNLLNRGPLRRLPTLISTCGRCHGKGEIDPRRVMRPPFRCPECEGSGELYDGKPYRLYRASWGTAQEPGA